MVFKEWGQKSRSIAKKTKLQEYLEKRPARAKNHPREQKLPPPSLRKLTEWGRNYEPQVWGSRLNRFEQNPNSSRTAITGIVSKSPWGSYQFTGPSVMEAYHFEGSHGHSRGGRALPQAPIAENCLLLLRITVVIEIHVPAS